MKTVRLFATAAIALAVITGTAQAQTHTVTFSVGAISTLSLGPNPAALNVTAAAAGQPPNSVSQPSTYSITTNEPNRKITAVLGPTAMPNGLTLSVNVAAPSTGTTAGTVVVGTTAVDVVTSIDPVSQANLGITYTLSATAVAAPAAGATRTVTYTIVAGT